MKKVIIFRTVRPEEMGYVVQAIAEKYGLDYEFSIITRPENGVTMEAIPLVKNVICFAANTFHISNASRQYIAELKKHKFDIAIIPTNGNLDSYDNVIHFKNKIFGDIPTYYYMYPKDFIKYRKKIFRTFLKTVIKILSAILTIPLMIAYFCGVIYYSFNE